MNNVEIEQVKVTKLLGVTLDCKRSWKKHIDTTVAKMGRCLSIIKRCSAFLTTLAGPTGPGFVPRDYCSVCGQVPQRGTGPKKDTES